MTTTNHCARCNGTLIRTMDPIGFGPVEACMMCGRTPVSEGWQPMTYTFHEPQLPVAVSQANLTGSCQECGTAIGPRAMRCNHCHQRAYEARRKVRRAEVREATR